MNSTALRPAYSSQKASYSKWTSAGSVSGKKEIHADLARARHFFELERVVMVSQPKPFRPQFGTERVETLRGQPVAGRGLEFPVERRDDEAFDAQRAVERHLRGKIVFESVQAHVGGESLQAGLVEDPAPLVGGPAVVSGEFDAVVAQPFEPAAARPRRRRRWNGAGSRVGGKEKMAWR